MSYLPFLAKCAVAEETQLNPHQLVSYPTLCVLILLKHILVLTDSPDYLVQKWFANVLMVNPS